MKKTVYPKIDIIDNNSSTESKSAITKFSKRMSDHEIENSSSNFVMSGEVDRQIKAVSDSLTRQLQRLCSFRVDTKTQGGAFW